MKSSKALPHMGLDLIFSLLQLFYPPNAFIGVFDFWLLLLCRNCSKRDFWLCILVLSWGGLHINMSLGWAPYKYVSGLAPDTHTLVPALVLVLLLVLVVHTCPLAPHQV